ncbi:MAG TPA: hypothetical protein VGH19_02945 [Verrucomicrobiae bacterium]
MSGRSYHTALFYLLCAISLWLGVGLVIAQSTIRYTAGPATSFAMQPGFSTPIDFDRDGEADVSFSGGGFLCTADVPTSSCSISYTGIPLSTNSLLCVGDQFAVLSAGALIGDSTGDTAWRGYASASLARYHMNLIQNTNTWHGPLSITKEGYLGVQFHSSSGRHYGWVRVRLPLPAQSPAEIELSPVILDWAYETQPDTAIKAGAMPVAAITVPKIVRPEKLRIDWATEIGMTYQVQFKEKLEAPGWKNLDISIVATGTNAIVDVPIKGAVGFYQAVKVE